MSGHLGRAIRYRGVDRHGQGRAGVTRTNDLADWVRRRFDAGWRSLEVEDVAPVAPGELVARIGCWPPEAPRTWWSE